MGQEGRINRKSAVHRDLKVAFAPSYTCEVHEFYFERYRLMRDRPVYRCFLDGEQLASMNRSDGPWHRRDGLVLVQREVLQVYSHIQNIYYVLRERHFSAVSGRDCGYRGCRSHASE